jgi:hypothetical protein
LAALAAIGYRPLIVRTPGTLVWTTNRTFTL